MGSAPHHDKTASNRAALRNAVDQIFAGRYEGALLFGSRARGDHNQESDWDVLVLLNDDQDPAKAKADAAEAAGTFAKQTGEIASILPVKWADWRSYATLLQNVAEEGVPL